jgi:hypothetical protein
MIAYSLVENNRKSRMLLAMDFSGDATLATFSHLNGEHIVPPNRIERCALLQILILRYGAV